VPTFALITPGGSALGAFELEDDENAGGRDHPPAW
jgi:hypothetical protein